MANKNLAILPGAFDEIYVRNWKCDEEMSDSSTAPVQNKVIKEYVDNSLNNIRNIESHIPSKYNVRFNIVYIIK